MEMREMLYEGKAKKVYATEDPELLIVSYKDDATAFNGKKKGTITGKGAINNRVTNFMMQRLEEQGVPTHFVEELNDRSEKSGDRSSGSYYPKHFRRQLCQALRRGRRYPL